VRFVIHHSMPKSLEAFMQESGRAGRDGAPAHSVLFYTYADKKHLEWMIKQRSDENALPKSPDVIRSNMKKLYQMVRKLTSPRAVRCFGHCGRRSLLFCRLPASVSGVVLREQR
jgi:superfamily II DNA helicase RecQ